MTNVIKNYVDERHNHLLVVFACSNWGSFRGFSIKPEAQLFASKVGKHCFLSYERERQGPDRAVGPILVVRSATLVRSAIGVSFFLRFSEYFKNQISSK